MFWPSTYPTSFRPLRNAVNSRANSVPADALLLLMKPITGIAGCCEQALRGHPAAVPPRRVMNSRRLIRLSFRLGPHDGPRSKADLLRFETGRSRELSPFDLWIAL